MSGAPVSQPQLVRIPYRLDSRAAYAGLRDLDWPVWLDSGFPRSGDGRYDIITADPYATLMSEDGLTRVTTADEINKATERQPFELLRELLGETDPAPAGLPFAGGAVGFIGYDFARHLDLLGPRAGLDGWPDLAIGIYDWALVVDHTRRRSYVVSQGRDPRGAVAWQRVLKRLLDVTTVPPAPAPVHGELLTPGLSRDDYAAGFDRIQRYIHDGDCYQANFAQRFVAHVEVGPWTLYQRMRTENPAPYGALLEFPFGQVLSSSPEQFLQLRDGHAQSRPIKGTRPRAGSAGQDDRLRAELRNSEKDRAENLMIVDLLRNDLGRVCRPGSIHVPGLFEVESFATVHHLVSTVSGELAKGRDAIDLIAACFPGGSITGAPKRRAMQIIDELEPVRREVYCGNVIRLGFNGDLDSNITIRTALMQGGRLYYWAGGAIVADSDCDAEYQESIDKAAAFLRLIGQSLDSFQHS